MGHQERSFDNDSECTCSEEKDNTNILSKRTCSEEKNDKNVLSTSIIDARFKGIHYFPELKVEEKAPKSKDVHKKSRPTRRDRPLISGGHARINGAREPQRYARTNGPSAIENLRTSEARRMNKLIEDASRTMSTAYSREYQLAQEKAARVIQLESNRVRELQQAGRAFLEREQYASLLRKRNAEKKALAETRVEQLLRAEGMQRLELYEADAMRYIRQCAKQQLLSQEKLSDKSLYRQAQHQVALKKLQEDERRRRCEIEKRVLAEQDRLNRFTAQRERYRRAYAKQRFDLERAKLGLDIKGGANAAFVAEQIARQTELQGQHMLEVQEHKQRIEKQQQELRLERQQLGEQRKLDRQRRHEQMQGMFLQRQNRAGVQNGHCSEFDRPSAGPMVFNNWCAAPSPASTATCSYLPSRVVSREGLSVSSDRSDGFIFSEAPQVYQPENPCDAVETSGQLHGSAAWAAMQDLSTGGGEMHLSRSAGYIRQARFNTPPYILAESPQLACDSSSLPPPEGSLHGGTFQCVRAEESGPEHNPVNHEQYFQDHEASRYCSPRPPITSADQEQQSSYFASQQNLDQRSALLLHQQEAQRLRQLPEQQHSVTPQQPHCPPNTQWFYIDTQGQVQGPFDQQRMRTWNQRGLFPADLLVQAETALPNAFQPLNTIYPHIQDAFAEGPC